MSVGSKIKTTVIALGVMGSIAALVYVIAGPKPVEVDVVKVQKGLFRETIETNGVFRSKRRTTVSVKADGDIKAVDLRVGDIVQKGQPITELYWDVAFEPVRAPMAGVISKIFRESAGPIRRGDSLVEIVDPHQVEVVLELLTMDAVRLREGKPARIFGWGTNNEITAKISRISRAGYVKVSALGVEEERTEVILNLDKIPAELANKIGSTFHVDVELEVSRHENVHSIPLGALFRSGELWAVYRVANGRAEIRTIEIGPRGSGRVVVTKGLSEGEGIVNYPGDLLHHGSLILERRI